MTLTITADDLDEILTTRHDGSPVRTATFICDFESDVDPEAFCNDVFDADSPYDAWGASIQIGSNEETGDEYWKTPAVLYHIDEDDERMDATKFTIEVAPTWMRCYIEPDTDLDRVLDFLTALDTEYAMTVTLPEVPTDD